MSFVMSAGLVQVETSLAQAEQRSGDQFVLVQECFRHFDLDKVGTDGIHLSMFEMPGAFVFGSNGKAETLRRMWTLATSVLGVDPDRIWVSYFRGGRVLGNDLPADEITREVWAGLGVSQDRIVGLVDDNYWVQGGGIDGMETPRKAGPNSELFWDRGADKACGVHCRPSCRCGRFIEFSNSLFICKEVDRETGGLRSMQEPFSETVIGTERLAMILQNTPTVFDVDSYRPILETIHSLVRNVELPESLMISSEQVIADHAKALYVLVVDGAPPPGKNGRERIIKLLIRGMVMRAIILGIEPESLLGPIMGCLSRLVPDDLRATPEDELRLQTYFADESRRFLETIRRGQQQLQAMVRANHGQTLSGQQIVYLEKQWGIPHLLAANMLKQQGLAFAEAAYRRALCQWQSEEYEHDA